ncbi:hypothetical protein SH528x_003473 [Novipirellula sp. SH528]|uniref:hypothetical protein n=1 Tax=Novipirellula sp. SH528 TaxID=3454466 RepID=UPI003F9EEC9B
MNAKPKYDALPRAELPRLRDQYQTLASNLERAWHQSSRHLFDLNREFKQKGKRVPEIEWLTAYEPVWEHFDLRTRAALYLCDQAVPRMSLRALQHARDGSHGIDPVQVAAYVDLFPYSMFQHHCDLDWHSGERYRLRLPKITSIRAECVIEDFAYYIEARNESSNHVDYGYVTIRDHQLTKLDTWDYDEVLDYSSDGRCYYIQ